MKRLLFLLSIVFFSGNVFAACNATYERDIIFSDAKTPDRFISTISGVNCKELTQNIKIINSFGNEIYSITKTISPSRHDKNDLKRAERIAQHAISDHVIEPSSKLPKWLTPDDVEYHNTYFFGAMEVDEAYYNFIRNSDWVIYTINIGYEGLLTLTYDRNLKKIVVVANGSP